MSTLRVIPLLLLMLSFNLVAADTSYQPFVLAATTDASLEDQTSSTIAALEGAGFTVVGQHSPRPGANVIVVTSPELLAAAGKSEKGGYGASQRVSIVSTADGVEIAFVNPLYIRYAYRMDADLQPVYDQLSATLGVQEEFGAKKKMTAKKLGKYHYMVGMQRFDNPYELGTFESYAAAVQAVETGLAIADDGLTQVYRIDIPGKEQTVFGVGMRAVSDDKEQLDIDETHQLEIVDFEGPARVAYFPYEILVDGNMVEALHMRFRMAVHFPDLSMMGAHGFTKLMSSPGATKDVMQDTVNAESQ
jgi:hypothetical protein